MVEDGYPAMRPTPTPVIVLLINQPSVSLIFHPSILVWEKKEDFQLA